MEEETPQELDEKRIDLSQFDAITPGNWEVIDAPNGGIHIGVRLGKNAHRHIITVTDSLGDQIKKIERDVADMNAIAAVPSLIAQLKICYEAIDHMKEALLEQANTNVFLVKTLEQTEIIKCANIDYCGHDSGRMAKERFRKVGALWICTNCQKVMT